MLKERGEMYEKYKKEDMFDKIIHNQRLQKLVR